MPISELLFAESFVKFIVEYFAIRKDLLSLRVIVTILAVVRQCEWLDLLRVILLAPAR